MRVHGYVSGFSVASVASFLLLACGNATGPGTYSYSCDSDAAPDLNDAQQAVLDAAPDPGMHTPDAVWAEIARQVPGGWGGFFFDEEGVPTIYLKDPDKSAEAIPALRELGAYDTAHVTAVAVKQGRWDFAQLYDWQRYIMLQDVWSAGIISSDIDEFNNRLVFGVPAEDADEVAEFFSSLHLPCDLVVLQRDFPLVDVQRVLSP